MKNLKLTNLEKMQQDEMKNVYGGRKWFARLGRKYKGEDACLCHGYCGGDSSRKSEGKNLAANNSHAWQHNPDDNTWW